MIVPDVDYRNAVEAIDQLMDSIRDLLEEEGGYRNQIRIASGTEIGRAGWTIVKDTGQPAEERTLLYYSGNILEIVAYLNGWLDGKQWVTVKNEEDEDD